MRESWLDRGILIYYHRHIAVSSKLTLGVCVCVCVRYEKLAEQEEISAQQQRRRLFAELQAERDKMTAQWNQQNTELEQQKADAFVS